MPDLRQRIETYSKAIEKKYFKAIDDIIRSVYGLNIDSSKGFDIKDYPAAKVRINKILKQLSKEIEVSILAATKQEWYLSNQEYDNLVNEVFPNVPEAKLKPYNVMNLQALASFQNRKIKGLGLSDRVWRLTQQLQGELEMALDVGLSNGDSAQVISRDIRQYLNNPDKLFRRVRDKNGILKLSKNAANYHPGQGIYRSSFKNAMRLARTETNLAYRTAEQERIERLDFVVGYEVVLSGSHKILMPNGDICDHLKGKYPKSFKFTGWHPQCMCQRLTVLMNDKELGQLQDAILKGESTAIKSRNEIKTLPKGFNQWVKDNAERSAKWKSQPYFIRDNFRGGTIEGGLNLANINPVNIRAIKDLPNNKDVYSIIAKAENKIRMNKSFETAIIFDKNGNEVFRKKGEATSVDLSNEDLLNIKNNIFTHNHPIGWKSKENTIGRIGNSFSAADVFVAIGNDAAEVRAVTPNYTFRLIRPDSGWGDIDKIKNDYIKINDEVLNSNLELIYRTQSDQDVDRANITHYHTIWKKLFKKYGITYTKAKTR